MKSRTEKTTANVDDNVHHIDECPMLAPVEQGLPVVNTAAAGGVSRRSVEIKLSEEESKMLTDALRKRLKIARAHSWLLQLPGDKRVH